ncbi:DsbA family protein [Halocatena halophila]|uniref:DsbA family protein n=1 Tax=Halocatena halophila TaxID=2814576 RepID=UPI002ED55215
MKSEEQSSTRRAVLSGTSTALIGILAGCISGDTDKPQATDRGSGGGTGGQGTDTTATDSSGTYVQTAEQNEPQVPNDKDKEPKQPLSPPFRVGSGTTDYNIELDNKPVIAATDDPVIDIYMWTDYQCRFCKKFEGNALGYLVANDVREKTARIVMQNYPHKGGNSMTAAVMAKCLWEQVKDDDPQLFWEWHHTVFNNQQLPEESWSSRSSLLQYARNINGIDAPSLDQCMQANRTGHEKTIRAEKQRGTKEGIKETPGFVIYHRDSEATSPPLMAAQPYTTFETQIYKLRNNA